MVIAVDAIDKSIEIRTDTITINAVTIGATPLINAIEHTRELTLSYKDAMFAFDFAALNFSSSYLNRYWYKLDGFDQDWNDVGTARTATYTNLNPGQYTFRVRAMTSAGAPSAEDEGIHITITPPPWRTGWAYFLYIALGVALGTILYAVGRLKKSSDSYREQSIRDPLSGIYNRAGLMNIAQGLYANSKIQRNVGVMLVDIDHFKRVNDTLGHDIGDRVIIGVAQLLQQTVRGGDQVGRWGGEEFVILFPDTTKHGAESLAEKIRSTVADYVFEGEARPLKVTISIGVALTQTDESFEMALKIADERLYKAKEAGRNCIVMQD